MDKKIKYYKRELKSLKIQKAKNWNKEKSDILELMACETYILKFLHKEGELCDDVKPITKYCLFDFWRWIQNHKEKLGVKIEE